MSPLLRSRAGPLVSSIIYNNQTVLLCKKVMRYLTRLRKAGWYSSVVSYWGIILVEPPIFFNEYHHGKPSSRQNLRRRIGQDELTFHAILLLVSKRVRNASIRSSRTMDGAGQEEEEEITTDGTDLLVADYLCIGSGPGCVLFCLVCTECPLRLPFNWGLVSRDTQTWLKTIWQSSKQRTLSMTTNEFSRNRRGSSET